MAPGDCDDLSIPLKDGQPLLGPLLVYEIVHKGLQYFDLYLWLR